MAIIRAHRKIDTRDIEFHGGAVDRASPRTIVIDNGVYETTYRGRFSYSADYEVFGRVKSIEQTYRDKPVFEAEGLDASAGRLFRLYLQDRHDEILPLLLDGGDRIAGSAKGDFIDAFGGRDTVNGGAGDDTLRGGEAADLLRGGSGDDRLDGGKGADRLIGGAGDDVYRADGRDTLVEKREGGNDTVQAREDFKLGAEIEDLILLGSGNLDGKGNRGDNRIEGNDGRNTLSGGVGDDRLFGAGDRDELSGSRGDDRLDGGAGRDLLIGGAGADRLAGGSGNDVFRFLGVGDSSGGEKDRIVDFSGGDRIDLSRIDADETRRGDQAFDFIGRKGFTEDAGELRFRGGLLSGDTDGDGRADFRVAIDDVRTLHEDAFLL